MFWSIGGSKARPARRTMPTTKIMTSAMTRLRSRKIFGSMKGALAPVMWMTKTQIAETARPSSIQISGEENQSTCSPRSRKSCSAPMKIDSMAKPKKSNPRERFGLFGRKAIMPASANAPIGRLTKKT